MSNKKIYQKIQFFRCVSIGGIFCLLIVQLYFLFSTYKNISKTVSRTIDEVFVKSVKKHRTYRLRKIKKNANKLSITFSNPKKNTKSSKGGADISDKVLKFGNKMDIDEAMRKASSYIISKQPLELTVLDSIFNKQLKEKHLLLNYNIITYKADSIFNTANNFQLNTTKKRELDITTQASVSYENPVMQIFQKMLWFFIFSVLLIIVISYALLYQFRMISQQKNIEIIRQDFVDSMTHELKHPLQGALAMTEILENSSFVENETLRTNAITKIKSNLRSLGNLLDNIVEKSYSKKFQNTAEISQNNIQEDINEIVANCKIISNKKINFQTNYHNLKEFYSYDKVHFPNAIKNLIDNAIKYSNDTAIQIDVKEENNNIIIAIKDNGIGIKKSELNVIFNKFYRIPNIKKNHGFGLGLSYVKWVCDIHDGKVSVKSTFGKGATFCITIPNLEL